MTRWMYAEPDSGRVRSFRITCGAGPVRKTPRLVARLTLPPGRVTDFAAPGAETLSSRSGVPLLTTAKNRPADWPALSWLVTGAPRTKTFLMAIWPT